MTRCFRCGSKIEKGYTLCEACARKLHNSEKQIPMSVIEDIKDDIRIYHLDCCFDSDTADCIKCVDNIFGSILRIIDKHVEGSAE